MLKFRDLEFQQNIAARARQMPMGYDAFESMNLELSQEKRIKRIGLELTEKT